MQILNSAVPPFYRKDSTTPRVLIGGGGGVLSPNTGELYIVLSKKFKIREVCFEPFPTDICSSQLKNHSIINNLFGNQFINFSSQLQFALFKIEWIESCPVSCILWWILCTYGRQAFKLKDLLLIDANRYYHKK